ncbi:MAG: MotA/TolQ/ExbB proton channel family protein [Chlamydiia bacterium]|nr:MotA/TolQ/ExbB proton channel family protein [Chlamydiia bacterium]
MSNLILLIIGFISFIGVMIFIERLIVIKKSQVDINKLLISLRSAIEAKNMVEAIHICDETKGPVASIIKVGLGKQSRSKSEIESAIKTQGLIEIANLEKNAKILSLIAHIAPLIGLLGTVLGFIQAFSEMRMSGLVDISATRIGEAMEFALVTTAAGLVVAIPAIVGYNYLVTLIEQHLLEMETVSSEVVDLLVFGDEI